MLLVALGLALATAACSGRSKADKSFDKGMLFLKHRRYYNAIEKFEIALELQPDHLRARIKCADAYLKTDKPEQAIQYAAKALERAPEDEEASMILGQAHLALAFEGATVDADGRPVLDPEHMDAAAAIAAALRQRRPDSIEGSLLQARIDYYSGHSDAAQRLYRLVLDKDPSNVIGQIGLIDLLMNRRQYVEAEMMARKALDATPRDAVPNPAFTGQLALSLLHQNRHDDAYLALEPYIDSDNKTPDRALYLVAGQVLLSHLQALGRPAGEAAALDAATTTTAVAQAGDEPAGYKDVVDRLARLGSAMKGIYGALPDSYFFRAISYELQGNMPEAIKHYEEAASRASTNKRYRLALAMAYLKATNYSQAQQELSTLLKNYPGDFDGRLAMAAVRSAEGSEAEALSLLRGLNLEQPDNSRVLAMLSRLLVSSDDPREVEEGLRFMNKLATRSDLSPIDQEYIHAQAAISEGMALARQGRPRQAGDKLLQAEALLRQLVAHQPDHIQAELLLSDLASRRGDLFSALAHTRRAATLDPRYLPRLARLYEGLGQLEAAESVYRKLILEQPEAVGHAVRLAEIALRRNQPQEALRQLDQMIGERPEDSRLYINKARALRQTGETEKALETLKAAFEKLPNEASLTMELARCHMSLGQADEAVRLLSQALKPAGERLTLMRAQGSVESEINQMMLNLSGINMELAIAEVLAGSYAAAADHATQSEQLVSANAEQASLLRAVSRLGQEDPLGANQAVEKARAVASNPPPAAPFLQALALTAAGSREDGIELLDAADQIDPDTRMLFESLLTGTDPALLTRNDAAIAIQVMLAGSASYARPLLDRCNSLLTTMPDDPFLLSRKGETLRLLGNDDEALAIYDHLAGLVPASGAVPLVACEIHMDLGLQARANGNPTLAAEHLAKAETYGREALKRAPNNAKTAEKLALVLQAGGRTDEANVLYRQLIQIDAGNWTAYNNLAWNLAQSGAVDDAVQVGEKALENAPSVGPVRGGILDTVGWVELRRGNVERALELLKEAGLHAPNNPEIRFHLAQAFEKADQEDEAVGQLEAIILSTPGYPAIGEVREALGRLRPDSPLLRPAAAGVPAGGARPAGA
jgi:tetratricopeptide (TPR) repeat protein